MNNADPLPPVFHSSGFGAMRVSDFRAEAYSWERPVGWPDFSQTRFKIVFNSPVTNRTVKWLTYWFGDEGATYSGYAVHREDISGLEGAEHLLADGGGSGVGRFLDLIFPVLDLNGDFDLDGDVDGTDTTLRASPDASLVLSPSWQEGELLGTGAVAVTVSGNIFGPAMPDSVLRIRLSGAEPEERFRLWSGAVGPLIHPMMGGGGGDPELIEDPLLLIDTELQSEYGWPVGGYPGYEYSPGFPKTLYLECVSCGTTNDGRAGLELVYEYNGEEICAAALPITVIRSKLVPDWNHDRIIDMADQNQSINSAPFHFWINDDKDQGDVSEGDSDVPGQGGLFGDANYKDNQVNGRSDLLDFFPVWLDI